MPTLRPAFKKDGTVDRAEHEHAAPLGRIRAWASAGVDPQLIGTGPIATVPKALAKPIGASGCRLLVTLLHNLHRLDRRLGLATLCIGGGQGIAMVVER